MRRVFVVALLGCGIVLFAVCSGGNDGSSKQQRGADGSSGEASTADASDAGFDGAADAGSVLDGAVALACYKPPVNAASYAPDYTRFRPNRSGACRIANTNIETGLVGDCGTRCQPATFEATSNCDGDTDCIKLALAADTAPAAPIDTDVDLGDGVIKMLNCSNCISLQNVSCQYVVCPEQTAAVDACFAALMPGETYEVKCATEEARFQTCFFAAIDYFNRCAELREGSCYGNPLVLESKR